MRPSEPDPQATAELFRARLSQQIDRRHPLVRLAGLIDWGVCEDFGALYHPHVGRPGIPIRLMVGLSYLQHTLDFCGFDYLQLALPIDPSSLVRWRQRIGRDGIELLLQETIAAAQRAEAIKAQSLERVSVDTTVQPKAIAPPLDSRLYHRGREILVRLAKRYAHARQMKRARREIKRLKTYLGRVFRDVRRKIEGRPEVAAHFADALARVERVLAQQRTDKDKLYALHAPEVACIAKGKAHKKYEFGAKLSVAIPNRGGLVVGMQSHPGNPTCA